MKRNAMTNRIRKLFQAPGHPGPPAPSTGSVLGAAAALTAIWVVSAVFRLGHLAPGPVDLWWDAQMTASDGPAAHAVASVLAAIGTGLPASTIAVVVGLLVGAVRGWAWGALVVAASVLSALDVSGMKALAQRTRPDPAFGLHNAFPSGHTANAALLGAVVFLLVGHVVVRTLSIVWPLVMAWSRTELHAHWATDVVAALVTGTATAVLLVALLQWLARRQQRIAPHPASSQR